MRRTTLLAALCAAALCRAAPVPDDQRDVLLKALERQTQGFEVMVESMNEYPRDVDNMRSMEQIARKAHLVAMDAAATAHTPEMYAFLQRSADVHGYVVARLGALASEDLPDAPRGDYDAKRWFSAEAEHLAKRVAADEALVRDIINRER
jgi:hypothetical protein